MAAGRVPGDLLLHPVVVVSIVLVIFNDRVLKPYFPSDLSGKLSDVTGPVFFPLFLVSAIEGIRWLRDREHWQLTSRAVDVAVAVVGIAFVLIKVWHPAAEFYRTWLGVALWPFDSLVSLVRGDGLAPLGRARLVEDPTDLVGVVTLALPLWIGHSMMAPPRQRQDERNDETQRS